MNSRAQRHRLLYVVGQLEGGGLERQLCHLLGGLDREIYFPAVAVWTYSAQAALVDRLLRLGIRIYTLNSHLGRLGKLKRLRHVIQETRPEVVHSFSPYTNFPTWCASMRLPVLTVGSIRNDYWAERRSLGPVRSFLCCRFPPRQISNSFNAQQQAMSDPSWWSPRDVEFIPNHVDTEQFSWAPLPNAADFEIIGIGRLHPQKGWDDALEALSRLTCISFRNWRFRICGEGPLLDHLLDRCNSLGISQRVQFMGYVTDIPSLIASSHMLLATSLHEGTPNVVLEAMACGRPVVATSVGDIPRLITHGKEGYLARPRDIRGISTALHALIDNPEMAIRMGNAARKRAEQESSSTLLTDRTLNAYRRFGWKGSPS